MNDPAQVLFRRKAEASGLKAAAQEEHYANREPLVIQQRPAR
jgi:hypothetical protein